MEYNELIRKIQEINSMINSGCDLKYIEDNLKYALEAGKHYEQLLNSSERKTNEIIDCYSFFTKYFLVYMAKKYDKSFKFDIASNTEDSFYSNLDNAINISRNNIGKDFEIIVFKIFHEFRHKMQFDDMVQSNNRKGINTIDNLLNIDPATIIFIKEQATLSDSNLYKRNHDCYTMEHDANLFSLSECKQFFKTDLIEKVYAGELSNYVKAILEGSDLSDKEYSDKQKLPIVYEEDYRYKKYADGKNISETSLLSLIYTTEGKPKMYEELLQDKQKLIEKFKGQVIDRKTSTTDYKKWSSPRTSKQHIEEIYKLIIASDPILTIQEYLSKYNKLKGELTAKKWSGKIDELLENCPQLVDMYSKEISEIFKKELYKGNKELIQGILENFPQKEMAKEVNSFIAAITAKPSSSFDSIDSTEAELFEENLPYGARKEEQKTSSFPKFKPVEQTKHLDFVQDSSPKQQESKSKFQNIDDKKKKQEKQKRKDNLEDLKKMQEMVEMAKQQKMQQDFINSQEAMEEDQGMSL